MFIDNLLFLLFGSLAIFSALMVISSKNPIHSILFLILVFLNSTGLLMLLGIEFLAIMFVIVYVGAIAILFLFVVMMLNIKIIELNENMTRFIPIGGLIGLLFFLQLYLVYDHDLMKLSEFINNPLNAQLFWDKNIVNLTNIQIMGESLYTVYFYPFLIASLILLVAMIGAIVLTLHSQANIKRQEIFKQSSRYLSRTITFKD